MKTTLLRLSRRAACLVLAGGLLTSCSLLPAASPRHEGTASSQAPQYYSDAWLSDDSLHYVYSYAGNGGGTILRGGRVLYKASSSDSIQLLKDTLTGETGHYLVAHSTPGTEERTSTLYDADGNAVMTFPYAVSATLSGGLLILRDDADVWAFENGTTGGIRVYDLATGAELPVPETALDCLVVDEDSQRLIFNCYDLPEGLTYAYDDPDQPLHQYVLITDREGNVLMREDGCTANTLASYRGGFADWLDLSWFLGHRPRSPLQRHHRRTAHRRRGQRRLGLRRGRRLPSEPSGQPLRPLRFEQRRGRGAGPLRLVCDGLHARLCHPSRQR